MKIEIKNRWNGSVLFACEAGSMKLAVEMAIKAHANLAYANLTGANLTRANLTRADLTYANLTRAYLTRANLTRANLTGADLAGANLDYSAWPLWCGTKKVKVDLKFTRQLAAHFCALKCDAPEFVEAKKAIIKFAMESHVAGHLEIGKGE